MFNTKWVTYTFVRLCTKVYRILLTNAETKVYTSVRKARLMANKGNIRFNPERENDRAIVETIKLLAPHYFMQPQQLARMAIHRGLVELAAEKKVKIPLTRTQSAAAD